MNWARAFARSGPPSKAGPARTWLRVAGAVLLVGALLSMSNPGRALAHLRQADPGLIGLAVLLLVVQAAVAAHRWSTVGSVFAPGMRLADFVRFTYIAQFFNQVLPASIGGDAARVWLHHTRGATLRDALLATLADRFLGLFSLFALAAGALLAFHDRLASLRLWGAAVVLCSSGVLASLALLMIGLLPAGTWSRWAAARLFVDLSNGLRRILVSPATGPAVAVTSLLVHALSVAAVWILALSVGLRVEIALLMVAVPVSLLAATVPLSIGGWGLREGTLVAILAARGTDGDLALALSLLFGLSLFAVGVVGALGFVGLVATLPGADADPPRS